MNKKIFLLLTLPILVSLSACGGTPSASTSVAPSTEDSASVSTEPSVSQIEATPDVDSEMFDVFYQHDAKAFNGAEGVLLISKTSFLTTVNSLEVRWGTSDGAFEDYSLIAQFADLKSSDFEYEFSRNSLIPMDATKIWVEGYSSSHELLTKASCGVESYKQNQNLLYEFQVLSDTHISTTSAGFYRRSVKAFTDIKENSPETSGIIVNGDIVDESSSADYDRFFQAYDSVYDNRDKLTIGLGNHEFIVQSETDYASGDEAALQKKYDDRLALWEEKTGNTSPYFSKIINGSYYIFVGTTKMPENLDGNTRADCVLGSEQVQWLEDTMELAGKTGKPIYIFSHGSLRDTVSGSLTELGQTWYGYQEAEEAQIRNIIKDYPQALFFSSHSHWCFESASPYLISDNYPSFFNTASVAYLWQGNGGGTSYENGGYENGGGQGLYVEVYDSQVVIKGRQFEAADCTSKYWYSGYQVVLPTK